MKRALLVLVPLALGLVVTCAPTLRHAIARECGWVWSRRGLKIEQLEADIALLRQGCAAEHSRLALRIKIQESASRLEPVEAGWFPRPAVR